MTTAEISPNSNSQSIIRSRFWRFIGITQRPNLAYNPPFLRLRRANTQNNVCGHPTTLQLTPCSDHDKLFTCAYHGSFIHTFRLCEVCTHTRERKQRAESTNRQPLIVIKQSRAYGVRCQFSTASSQSNPKIDSLRSPSSYLPSWLYCRFTMLENSCRCSR